jgi:hypothetical protein
MTHLSPRQFEGLSQRAEDLICINDGFLVIVNPTAEHDEFVSTESSRKVTRPDARANPGRHGGKNQVPAGMAQKVVHHLETVQVKKEDGCVLVVVQAQGQLPE